MNIIYVCFGTIPLQFLKGDLPGVSSHVTLVASPENLFIEKSITDRNLLLLLLRNTHVREKFGCLLKRKDSSSSFKIVFLFNNVCIFFKTKFTKISTTLIHNKAVKVNNKLITTLVSGQN